MLNIKALLKTFDNDNVRELTLLEYIKNNEEIFKNYQKINNITSSERNFYFEELPKITGKIPKEKI